MSVEGPYVPEGLAVDRESGEPVTEVPLTAAAAAAGIVGRVCTRVGVLAVRHTFSRSFIYSHGYTRST